MSHPHAEHRAHKVEKRRVSHILRHHARGGAAHADEAADKSLVRHMVKRTALKVHGKSAKHRADRMARARGGRTNKKGTNVTVVVAPQGGGAHSVPPMPPAAASAAAPPRPMPAAPMPPPGAVPPVPPGMPMRAKGGRIKSGPAWEEGLRDGTQVQHSPGKNDMQDIGRKKAITYASGGKVKPQGRLVQFWAGGSVKRARGGKVESPQGVASATKLPGGSSGARARLVKERRAERSNHPASAIAS